MNVVIVDTDVASFQFKGDTRSALYTPHLAGTLSAISFMTLAELRQWAIIHKWGKRKQGELMEFITENFVIVDSNEALCFKWAEVKGAVRSVGRHIETADAWVAATALLYAAPLITHNANDFAHVPGLNIITEP
jgi:predicted nucleic acid-binding protein